METQEYTAGLSIVWIPIEMQSITVWSIVINNLLIPCKFVFGPFYVLLFEEFLSCTFSSHEGVAQDS